ncbi:10196_t:CDS:2, partial [Acaulospora morrowiae]
VLIAAGVKSGDSLISLRYTTPTTIPVLNSFVCGQNVTSITVQKLIRGAGGQKIDRAFDLPQTYVFNATTNYLTTGDWTAQTGEWPCFIFRPDNDLEFQQGVLDQIIILVFFQNNYTSKADNGLLFGLFDQSKEISAVEPFVGPLPSINTFTFTRSEKNEINGTILPFFTVNMQNIQIQNGGFGSNLGARFLYSPDTYQVLVYVEKRPYSYYDLFGAVGGLLTYSFGIWTFLYGRGKYKPWGIMQQYILKTSPNFQKEFYLLPYHQGSPLLIETSDHVSSSPSSTGAPQNHYTNLDVISLPGDSSCCTGDCELMKKIDARVNEKLCFMEQNLTRHYLSGFQTRNIQVVKNNLSEDNK